MYLNQKLATKVGQNVYELLLLFLFTATVSSASQKCLSAVSVSDGFCFARFAATIKANKHSTYYNNNIIIVTPPPTPPPPTSPSLTLTLPSSSASSS